MIWGRLKMGSKQRQARPWQKIVSPPENEVQNGSEPTGLVRRYLDLADVLIRRVQRRMERTQFRNGTRHRDAA